MKPPKKVNRRQFLGSAAAASVALTVVPRYVLGGPGYIAPSDKLTLGYVGCGTQGIREMASLIKDPRIQIVSVCDPNKMSTNYVDWSKYEIRNLMRQATGEQGWGESLKGIPGGRDIGQELVNKFYARTNSIPGFKGCSSFVDFREMFEKEKDINAVKIMTPDHLHAAISIAAMNKGMHVVTHKPIANRIREARAIIDTANKTGKSTHLLAWSQRAEYDLIKKIIHDGRIGALREIHNWSNRPVWQQWQSNPTDRPPVPKDFTWPLWLGPVPDRPYHPNYTHCVFRGWYDFGGGSIADMGHYSLFPLFLTLGITKPAVNAEAYGTTTRTTIDGVATDVRNDVAFPLSCIIRFGMPQQPDLPEFDLIWYDGGIKPVTPGELRMQGKSLTPEGMMFVGEKGKIIANFRGENPQLYISGRKEPLDPVESPQAGSDSANSVWINAFLDNQQSPGSFQNSAAVTETILLGGVALRARRYIEYDSATMSITNHGDSNKFITREYRQGWEL